MPKFDLTFTSPWLNAAGSLGFAPDPYGPVDLGQLGAFVTNPLSPAPRSPARLPSAGVRSLSYPGGFLLHTGYPNPGLKAALQRYAGPWARSPLPVLVHLLAPARAAASILAQMVRRLEGTAGVMGVELGLPPDVSGGAEVADWVRAAAGELPLVVRLPFDRADELAFGLVRAGLAEEIAAFSLAPPRGMLPAASGSLVRGRLYGPSIFPLALQIVQALVQAGRPVIGAGGIYHREEAQAMLSAGAFAVQLDAVLWHGGFDF